MRLSFLLLFLPAYPIFLTAQEAAVPTGTPAVQLTVELSDGSRVIGTPSVNHLKITTAYAGLDLPLLLFRSMEFGGGADRIARVSLQNGDLISARLAATEIALKTSFGQVVISIADVSRIEAVRAVGIGKTLPEGCVLYYTFNEDEAGRVTDASGSGNDGRTAQGASYVTEGKAQGAMSFNGRGQAVVSTGLDNLKLQDFTIMAWIRRGSRTKVCYSSAQAVIFGYGQGGYGFGIQEDGAFFVNQTGSAGVVSKCKINDDAYHHMAVTKKGSSIVFYLDGVAYPADDYDIKFEFNSDVAVGARPDNMNDSFLGLMNEVAVFNRPLSSDEVKGIYDAQK